MDVHSEIEHQGYGKEPVLGSVHGLVQKSSCDFVRKALAALNNNRTLLLLKDNPTELNPPAAPIETKIVPDAGGGWLRGLDYTHNESSEVALISFTSGTEGRPKGVLLSHRALSNTTDRLIHILEMDHTIREYVGVPVYHSFGFGRCRAVARVGGACFIPEHGFDITELARMLEAGEINALSAVPSLLRLLLKEAQLFRASGAAMRWIEIGSQFMGVEEKRQLLRLFPKAKIVQHYGLTEASRSCFLRLKDEAEQLHSVGRPVDGVEIRLSAEGLIMIRGPHLASGLLIDGEYQPLPEEDGWLLTSDLGELVQGHLHFRGRADDVINCAGIKISPEVMEEALRARLDLNEGIAVFRIPDELRGERVGVAVLENVGVTQARIATAAREALAEQGVESGAAIDITRCHAFPTTVSGKVRRKELSAQWREPPGTPTSQDPAPVSSTDVQSQHGGISEAALIAIWQDVLKVENVGLDESFFDLGGDSLSAISATLRMQQAGISPETCRRIFEGLTVRQLAALGASTDAEAGWRPSEEQAQIPQKTPLAHASQTLNAVRGLLVLLNIAAHWMPGFLAFMPAILVNVNVYLAPLYSSGTPGFAMTFGAGIGFFLLPRYLKERASAWAVVKRNLILLAAGISLFAVFRIGALDAGGEVIDGMAISNSFWSVLTFYFLAVASLPLWMRLLVNRWPFFNCCMAMALLFYSIHIAVEIYGISPSVNPLVQPWVLAATAYYNYFEMSAGVLVGAAFGWRMRESVLAGSELRTYTVSGLALMAFSVLLSFEMGQADYWFLWPKGLFLWSWCFYLGALLLGISVLHRFLVQRAAEYDGNPLIRLLEIIGIMAFPLFIGHELVLPLRDILQAAGIPGALAMAMLPFFLASGFGIYYLYGAYYGRATTRSDVSLQTGIQQT